MPDSAPREAARRPVVLVFASHYLPAFRAGGPIRTLANMVGALREEVDFRIFTRDHDFGRPEPLAGVPPREWCDVGGARVFYGSRQDRGGRAIVTLLREVRPDVVYLNSFFDPTFSILPLALRRAGLVERGVIWVIAPRGEFSEGALAIKAEKKRAFLRVASALGLHRGLVWQASSEFEAGRIRSKMGAIAQVIEVAPNLTAPVEPLAVASPNRPGEPLAACFIGRVSAMKNLRFAIEVVSRVSRPVRFDIYGPIE
ncbi:MAG: glycosyl transferase family 1, partial [Alphaproteobacteria bacterium]